MSRWKGIVYAAAGLSVIAAAIHAALMPEHMEEWWGYGAFFLAAAVVQGAYGIALVRWTRPPVLMFGIVANLAIVALYVWTRTVGIPVFGPDAGEVEEWGTIGLLTALVEVALVGALAALLRAQENDPARSGMVAAR